MEKEAVLSRRPRFFYSQNFIGGRMFDKVVVEKSETSAQEQIAF